MLAIFPNDFLETVMIIIHGSVFLADIKFTCPAAEIH